MKKRICPKCKSSKVVPIVYGLPDSELGRQEREGEVELGGCIVSEDDPKWSCKDCGCKWGRQENY